MEELVKKLGEQSLTTSQVRTISNASVPKTAKKKTELVWVDVAKRLLNKVGEQDDVTLSHNVRIFIEISVKAEVKDCMSSPAKLIRKRCPQISGLLTHIQCLADTESQPTKSMHELDVNGLTGILLAAVVDLQVTGVRAGDEKTIVAELYAKLTTLFEQYSERLCDCLLLCRCFIYKNYRKPRVLIPLIRRVLLSSGSSHSSIRCVSGTHYIKLLLLAKIWLFMVDTNEVSGVRSLVAGALKIPAFFKEWLDQNDISWLKKTDKNSIKVKNLLKCMTVSEVLESLYGANKLSTYIKQEKQINAPLVKGEKEIKDLVTNTKKKKKKRALSHEENLEDTQPSNKKSKKSNSLEEAQCNKNSSLPNKTEVATIKDDKEIKPDDAIKDKKKRKKKKKAKSEEEEVNPKGELNGGNETEVHPDLVNIGATKKKKKKKSKSKDGNLVTDICESKLDNRTNEDVSMELIDENVNSKDETKCDNEVSGESAKKKKKKKNKLDKLTAEDSIDGNGSVEKAADMEKVEKNVSEDVQIVAKEDVQLKLKISTVKKSPKNISSVEKQRNVEVPSVGKKPENEVSSAGWNVSPNSQEKTSNKKIGDFIVSPVKIFNQKVEQKGSAEVSVLTPGSKSKKKKNNDCVDINKEHEDIEDTPSSATLNLGQSRGRSREHITPTQSRERSRSLGRRIFTPDSRGSTPNEKQRERKLSGSTPEVQRDRRMSLSKEDILIHRKRVKRDSLTFTVTDLTMEEMALLKNNDKGVVLPEKDSGVEKVSLGIQTEVSSLNVKVVKPKAVLSINSVNEINENVKLLKPKLSSPGSYKVLKPRVELTKENGDSVEQDIVQKYTALGQSKTEKSQEVLKLNLSPNKNVNEESDSDIECLEEVMIVNNTSKTAKEVDGMPSDESDIDEASGTESDIVPCDESLKMFTDEENRIYHEKLMEDERKRKDAEMEQVVQKMLKKDEKEVQERMEKLNETEKDLTTTENTNNKKGNTAKIDSNQMLSKLYSNETKSSVSKDNEKESVCNAEEVEDNEGIEAVLQTIVSDTGRVESIQGLHESFTKEGEAETNKENVQPAETNKENVQPNENSSDIQIVEERTVLNENDSKVENQSLKDESTVNIIEIKENIPENSKTNDIIILGDNQDIKPESKEQEKEPLKTHKDDLENNDQSKNLKSDLKETIENAILIKNTENKSELVEDHGAEKELVSDITEAEGEVTHSKLSTDDDDCTKQKENSKTSTDDECTRQNDAKPWVSDQDEAYEACSDASEEQPRTPSHAIRKKMSERKRSATLANTQIASDSDMSPVRRTQRGMGSADKSKNRKKDSIQSSSAINLSTVDESVASMSIIPTVNDSSLESIFSSTSIISTDKQTDGSCETVIAGAAASVDTNGSDAVKQIMQNGDSDTLESIDDSSMVSQELCDNTKSTLDSDKTIVADTISSDVTEEVMEAENNIKESMLLSHDLVDIDEDEELEVLSTSGVDDDDTEEHISTSPRVTRSRKSLSSPNIVSSPGSTNATLKTIGGRRRSSLNQGKIAGETQDKLGNQALHKELIISPDESDEECELVSPEITVDSQDQAIETSDNSEDDVLSPNQSPAKTRSGGLRGMSSGRIRSPQKMIPEEQDETQPKLTRSRQRLQTNISASLSSPSGQGVKNSPKTQTRNMSNSLTVVGQMDINSTSTKGAVQSEILSPKLKGRKSISSKSNNSPAGLVNNVETDVKEKEIEEVKQIKRGRPRKSLVASPKKDNDTKTGKFNFSNSPAAGLVNNVETDVKEEVIEEIKQIKRGRPRKSLVATPKKDTDAKSGERLKSPDLFTSPKSRLKSPELFTSPKSRLSALRESSQSPVSKQSRRQTSTSPATRSSPNVALGTRKNSSPMFSPRASSSVSPKPSPSTPRSRKTLMATVVSPNPNPASLTPKGRKNSNASPLRKNPSASPMLSPSPRGLKNSNASPLRKNPSASPLLSPSPRGRKNSNASPLRKNPLNSPLSSPSASNTSVYSTALSSLASPSPVKQTKDSGKKSKAKQDEKEEEKGGKGKVNDENKEESEKEMEVKEEKQTTLKRRSLPSKRKSVNNEKSEEKCIDVDHDSKEDMELVINVDNEDSEGRIRKSLIIDDIPSPSGRGRRSFVEVAEIQDEINDILPRRRTRRSEVANITEVQNEIKGKQETLKNKTNILQDSELDEESVEKRPLRSTRKSLLVEEDAMPLISSPRTRRSVLLLGDIEEKPKTPRARRLSESEATLNYSPRRSSRRSIGSGTQSAEESNPVQKISASQRRQSLAPLKEEAGNEDKVDTPKRKTRASIATPVYNTKDLRTRGGRTPVSTATPKGLIIDASEAPTELSKSIRPRRSIHSSK